MSVTEQILYQATTDSRFRTELLNDPRAFGLSRQDFFLPDMVEQRDQSLQNLWSEGIAAIEVYGCASTCSFGPFTFVCDGSTK